MMLLDLDAHFGHGREHLAPHVLRGILRRHREITLLGADMVSHIPAFVFSVGIGREFDRVDLKTCVVRFGGVFDVVEYEELGFRAKIDGVAHALRLHHALRLLGDATRVAVIGFAGGRLEHVADQ